MYQERNDMLPKLTVDGRLAAEPELRFGQSGTAVAKLRVVAADRRRDDQTGEWSDGDTLWLDVTCFGKLAENTVESVKKGDLVLIFGKLKTDEWNDKDTGQKRSKITMIADSVAVSLQFRVLPHAGEVHAARAPAPVEQAYGYGQDANPPF
jgi:single-strand DNA-binding protein